MTFIWFFIALILFFQNKFLKKALKVVDKEMDKIEDYVNEQDMEMSNISKLEEKLIDMEGKYNYYKTKSENLEKKLESFKEA